MASLHYLGAGGGGEERGNMSYETNVSDEVTADMFKILQDQRKYLEKDLPAKKPLQVGVRSAKQMAYMFNMYSWLQSTPDIEQGQIHKEFPLVHTEKAEAGGGAGLDTPRAAGVRSMVTHRALKLSPASNAILSRYEAKLVRLLRGGLLKQDEVAAFGKFTKASIPKVEYESTFGGKECTPKQIGDALRSVSPADQEPGKAIPTIISDPDDVHVRIGDDPYALKISVTPGQEGKFYPQIMLHHAAIVGPHRNPQWHVKMHPIDHDEMYVEELYYGTELGARLGPRIQAKQLFKFIADMGYTKVTLDDASSVQFLMPKSSGAALSHAAETGGYPFEFVDIKALPNQPEDYFRSLSMNLVNTVKHVVLSSRPTLRHYSGAAASVRDQAGAGAAEIDEEPLEAAVAQAVKEEIEEVRSTGYAQSEEVRSTGYAQSEDDKEVLEQHGGGAAAAPAFTIRFRDLPNAPARPSLQELFATAQGNAAAVLRRARAAAAAAEAAAPDTPPPRGTTVDTAAIASEAEVERAARRAEIREKALADTLHASFFRLKF